VALFHGVIAAWVVFTALRCQWPVQRHARPTGAVVESPHMSKIPGRLIVDMFPDGTVRLVFLAKTGSGNASPFTAKDLDAVEALFMTFGLTMEGAAALRGTVKRNKVASIEISIDEEIAQKFRYAEPN